MRAIEAVTTPGETAALCQSVGVSRASLYRRRRPVLPAPATRSRAPSPRALDATERQAVLDVLHSERFIDQSPAEVHATLLEEQRYLCAPRTMYRVLAAATEVRERRAQARHPVYTAPELVATRPNQVWSWDITKLKGPIPYLYLPRPGRRRAEGPAARVSAGRSWPVSSSCPSSSRGPGSGAHVRGSLRSDPGESRRQSG